jgi:rod shape determining protein RodA
MIKNILKLEWKIVGAVAFLLASSLISTYSFQVGGNVQEANIFFKQSIFIAIGFFFFLFFSFYDYRTWRKYSNFLYLLSLVLLFLVLFLGSNIRGTSGWFSFGFFNLQPVELVKVFSVIFLASYFVNVGNSKIDLKAFFKSFFLIIIPVALTLAQPDLGSASVLIIIWLGMSLLAGVDKKYLLAVFIGGLVILFLSWGLVFKDYQKERVLTFINPERDPLGSGYNVIQSIVAVGSGGLTGKGIGHGTQSQLNFLPEKHTDFMFASINEEFGFLGSFLVLSSFWFLFYLLTNIIRQSRDRFGQLLAGGVLIMYGYQVFVNIGMNIGIVPVTGISLPFLSYGGSFLVVAMIGLGMCQNVWIKRRKMVLHEN